MQLRQRLITLFFLLITAAPGLSQQVRLTETTWGGVGCYKIEMPMGTVYFEKDNGVSGFKSFVDTEGKDWIASYLPPGPKGEYRGFPNSVGNFGHAGRNSGSTTTIVDGRTAGDLVILESSNADFTFQYWFFADRVAIKVLKSKGEYCFLLECVAGGAADAEDYFVTADGRKHLPTADGEFDDFTPEWFYLGDPTAKNVLFLAKSPDDDAPNENHRQVLSGNVHNMDLYSFGRTGKEHKYQVRGMSGNDPVCIIGFADAALAHTEIAARITRYLEAPFVPTAATAPDASGGAASPIRWSGGLLKAEAAWYASTEARAAADRVLRYQSQAGAWPKNTDLLAPATDAALAEVQRGGKANTIDNGSTTAPMRFLALVGNATGEAKYHQAVLRGLDYLLAAQYPNGGFPQFYPLRQGYYSHITYNDGAMINTLELLRDVAQGREPFAVIGGEHRARAADAVARGIDCIIKTQIVQEGKLTAWCAQHDVVTLAPAWARAYEPPSLSGAESVGIVRFLMAVDKPSPGIVAAIENAVAWFREVPISGQRLDRVRNDDGRSERILVADPAAPPLWARFYELGTNRPLYLNRDSKPNYDFMKVSYERRSGYGYHTTAPADLIEHDYPAWRAQQAQTR